MLNNNPYGIKGYHFKYNNYIFYTRYHNNNIYGFYIFKIKRKFN